MLGSALLALHTRQWWACQKGQVCRTLGRSKWASFRSSAGRWRHQSTGGGYMYSPDREWSSAFSPAEKKKKKAPFEMRPTRSFQHSGPVAITQTEKFAKKKKKKRCQKSLMQSCRHRRAECDGCQKRKFHCFGVQWEKSACTHTHTHTVQRVKLASTSVLVECDVASDMTNHISDYWPPQQLKWSCQNGQSP